MFFTFKDIAFEIRAGPAEPPLLLIGLRKDISGTILSLLFTVKKFLIVTFCYTFLCTFTRLTILSFYFNKLNSNFTALNSGMRIAYILVHLLIFNQEGGLHGELFQKIL